MRFPQYGFQRTVGGSAWAGPGSPSWFPFTAPMAPGLLQLSLYAQGALFDPTPNANVPLGLTTAVRLTIGS